MKPWNWQSIPEAIEETRLLVERRCLGERIPCESWWWADSSALGDLDPAELACVWRLCLDGWGTWDRLVDDPDSDYWQCYREAGDYGVMGAGYKWRVVHGLDGLDVDGEKTCSTIARAMERANELGAALAEYERRVVHGMDDVYRWPDRAETHTHTGGNARWN